MPRNEVGVLSMCAESMSGDEMWIWMQWQWTVASVIAEFIGGKMITSSLLLVPGRDSNLARRYLLGSTLRILYSVYDVKCA